jgi:hypothetical protein
VHDYFRKLTRTNDLSLSAHTGVARFLGACHTTMLTWLKKKHEEGFDGKKLLSFWHHLMEENWDEREKFFLEVVTQASSVGNQCLASLLIVHCLTVKTVHW